MSAAREDLLHLSPEALAQVANLGLVKRATRELESGAAPELVLDEAATLTARFADGATTRWPAGANIRDASCSCGAPGVCRHRIMAALAYRSSATAAADAPPPELTSPGLADEATLAQCIPPKLLAAAEQQREAGLVIEVRRQASGEPCPTARLPAATVRFWSGAAVAAARCDCVQTSSCEHVALAVWAFRKADADAPAAAVHRVQLGAVARAASLDPAPYQALVASLSRHGIERGHAPHLQAVSAALAAAAGQSATWLQLVVGALEAWSRAYSARAAAFTLGTGVDLVGELALRLAAGGRPGQAKSALGIGEAGEVELDRLRLVCLGCRVEADHEARTARLVLADLDTGTRFVLDHQWQVPAGSDEAMLLQAERVAPGVKLAGLGGGQLLSQQARRTADGRLRLAKARSNQNSLLPQPGDWSFLGRPLCFERVADARTEKLGNPIPQIAPRHAAGSYAVFKVAAAETVFYDPNEQAVAAVLRDADGEAIRLLLTHRAVARHALDAAAGALTGHFGPLRHVAGPLRWEHGQAVLEPWAFACDRTIVPDLAPACGVLGTLPLGYAGTSGTDAIAAALQALGTLLNELLFRGCGQLGAGWQERSLAAAAQLRSLGFGRLADYLEQLRLRTQAAAANPAGVELGPAVLQLAALWRLHVEAAGQAADQPPAAAQSA